MRKRGGRPRERGIKEEGKGKREREGEEGGMEAVQDVNKGCLGAVWNQWNGTVFFLSLNFLEAFDYSEFPPPFSTSGMS